MRYVLRVEISEETGLPTVEVPVRWVKELARYLARQSTHVRYSFGNDQFTVRFEEADLEVAQEMMDAWMAGREGAVEEEVGSGRRMVD